MERSCKKDVMSPGIKLGSSRVIHRKTHGHLMKFTQRGIVYCFHTTLKKKFLSLLKISGLSKFLRKKIPEERE